MLATYRIVVQRLDVLFEGAEREESPLSLDLHKSAGSCQSVNNLLLSSTFLRPSTMAVSPVTDLLIADEIYGEVKLLDVKCWCSLAHASAHRFD